MIDFRLGRCRVTIEFWFIAAVSVLMIISEAFTAALLASVLHECGHLLCLMAFGRMPNKLRLHLFGADMPDAGCGNYKRDALVSLAGPFMNFIVFLLTMWAGDGFFAMLSASSAALAVFHILPVAPLDGGRALYLLLSGHIHPNKAEKIVTAVSFAVLLPMAILGFFLLLRSGYNFSLLFASMYLMAMLVFKKSETF